MKPNFVGDLQLDGKIRESITTAKDFNESEIKYLQKVTDSHYKESYNTYE